MSREAPVNMDVRTAWDNWALNGSTEAGAAFLARIESWTDGTAAQLARGARGLPSRDELADRLRHHLGVVAKGEPITYVAGMALARENVIQELRSGASGATAGRGAQAGRKRVPPATKPAMS